MKSVIYHLYTDRFPRIRIGIGRSKGEMINHVIGNISKEGMEAFSEAWKRAADAAICYVEEGISIAMNKYNPPRKKPEEEKLEES